MLSMSFSEFNETLHNTTQCTEADKHFAPEMPQFMYKIVSG